MTTRARLGLAGVLYLVSGSGVVRGQDAPPSIASFLSTAVGLSDADRRDIEKGKAVTRILPTALKRDVAVFGILAVDASRAAIAANLANTPDVLKVPGRIAFGVTHDSVSAADFDGLVLSPREATALRKCRPTSCVFKLSSSDMDRFHALGADSIGLSGASQVDRDRLAIIAGAYRQRGNDAMPAYDDTPTTVRGNDAFAAMHSEIRVLDPFAPGLRAYLDDYPRGPLHTVSDVIFWAKDDLPGLRATTTLNERIVYSTGDEAGVTIVATKVIDANHYLEAGLEVVVVIDRPETAGKGVYVMILRQYRMDKMPSILGVSLRGRVTSKLGQRTAEDLQQIAKQAARR